MRTALSLGLLWVTLLLPGISLGFEFEAPLPDADKESRAKAWFAQIRCPVCEGQSIAHSETEIAHNMRRVIRKLVAEEKRDDEIREFLVTRYGDHILLSPPIRSSTYMLWLGPVIFLILGTFLIVTLNRRHR